MKIAIKRMAVLILLAGMPGLSKAALSSGWSGTQAIADNDASGMAFNFSLTDAATSISDVSLTFNLSGGYNGDLYAYLSHGSGFAVLLNRVGRSAGNTDGYGNSGFAVTLSGSASADIHQYQSLGPGYNGNGQLTGTWGADGRFLDPASAASAFDSSPRNNTLSTFNGMNPNGTWTLFFADRSGGEVSTLTSWSVDITAVPEPVNLALGVFAGVFGSAAFWRRRSLKRNLGSSLNSRE